MPATKRAPVPIMTESVHTITIPRLQQAYQTVNLIGMTPYMQLRFSEKAISKIRATQEAGQQSRSRRTRQARDFEDDYQQAMHRFADGRHGIPCSAFRNAMISACRIVGFKMTIAKLSVFVESDGLDVVDKTPLVEIRGTPEPSVLPVRNATGVVDLRVRPLWQAWEVTLQIRWDISQFSPLDVLHLLDRAGKQVGVGEGRPDSRESAGLGYGLFRIQELEDEEDDDA